MTTSDASQGANSWSLPAIDPADTPQARKRRAEQEQELQRTTAVEKGYAEGIAQGQAQIFEQLTRLDGLISQLSQPLRELDDSVAESLVELSCRIARQVVRKELQLDRAQIIAIAREALQALPVAAREVRLSLHPEDAHLFAEAMADTGESRSWELIEDPLLSRGGLKIVTETSVVDASVEKRLDTIIGQLVDDERTGRRNPDADG
ncbi:MAG: FliH/SctL family protein [Pseudomonadota bacterium]